ncbi:hypothetical protein ACTHGU_14975 [Chitinophagaceae bacterium MMS25-I14]
MRNTLLFIALCLIWSSCGRVPCQDPQPYLRFNGFDSSELASIYISTFQKGSGFSKKTGNYVSGCYTRYTGNDSMTLYDVAALLYSGDDVDIYIPLAGKDYRFRDVSIKGNSQRSSFTGVHDVCANTVSYYENDIFYTQTPAPDDGNRPHGLEIDLNK